MNLDEEQIKEVKHIVEEMVGAGWVHSTPVTNFLEGLDAKELQDAALARMRWGSGNITENILMVLLEAANGI